METTFQPRLIAFDLDGTLLNDEKHLSQQTIEALYAAAAAGAVLVPATGRFPTALPEELSSMPFIRYIIAINGAQVVDRTHQRVLRQADIPLPLAQRIWDHLATLPVIFDCYQDGHGYMPADLYEQIDAFIPIPAVRELTKRLRSPLPNFSVEMARRGRPVQKIQMYFQDMEKRAEALVDLAARYPETVISSAIYNNLEINIASANKGDALAYLAEYLGIPKEETMAFGDGTNDISMLCMAGKGVAMANGAPQTLAIAGEITCTNEENGVAAVLRRYFPC